MNKLSFTGYILLFSLIYIVLLSLSYGLLDNVLLAWLFDITPDKSEQNFLLAIRHIPIVLIAALILSVVIVKKVNEKIVQLAFFSSMPALLIFVVLWLGSDKNVNLGIYNIMAIILIVIAPTLISFLLKNKSVGSTT